MPNQARTPQRRPAPKKTPNTGHIAKAVLLVLLLAIAVLLVIMLLPHSGGTAQGNNGEPGSLPGGTGYRYVL